MSESPLPASVYPDRIFLKERRGGGGYYTGVLSAEWERSGDRGDVPYVREDAIATLTARRDRLARLLRLIERGSDEPNAADEAKWMQYIASMALAALQTKG